MSKMRAVVGVLSVFVVAPIWYYLLYKILQSVGASELMWFLYWVYLPVAILAAVVTKIADASDVIRADPT